MKKFGFAAAALVAVSAQVFGAAPAMAQPELVKQVAPEYPRGAERRNIEGWVTVSFSVDASGAVANTSVVEATPAGVFDAAATKAVSKWKFKPGAPSDAIEVKLEFKLS